MSIDLIKNSLEYYDRNKELYQPFVDKIKYVSFNKSNDEIHHDNIKFYDTKKNEIHVSTYEEIGVYASDHMVWTWAWSIPSLRKNQTYIISKVLDYGIKLPPKDFFLKTELVTSRFKISTKVQLDIHTSIVSYLAKQPFILSYVFDPSVMNNENSKTYSFRELKSMEELKKLPSKSLVYFFYIINQPNL
jgi:hypothetical protein